MSLMLTAQRIMGEDKVYDIDQGQDQGQDQDQDQDDVTWDMEDLEY